MLLVKKKIFNKNPEVRQHQFVCQNIQAIHFHTHSYENPTTSGQ